MRPSTLAAHRSRLELLRAGSPFERAVPELRPVLEQRAERFLRVWGWCGQTSIGVEDLVQEMLVALWRAVDTWDPARADLVLYVDAQLGRACQRRLRQVAGYPDPRRSAPARQVAAEVPETGSAPSMLEERLDARRRADEVLSTLVGLERHAVELVLELGSIEETTRRIYADRSARIEYRMDSLRDARRMVGAAVRRATSVAEVSTSGAH